MATTWIKLTVDAFGQPAGTTLAIDAADLRLPQLLNARLATVVANPGGTPPTAPLPNPGGDMATDAELATAVAGKADLQKVAATVTTGGPAVAGKHNPVNATAGPITLTLPAGQPEGTQVSVEKIDATSNVVTVSGNLRGTAAQTVTLPWAHESLLLRTDATGSWWPIAGHKTKTTLDAVYGPAAQAVAPELRAAFGSGGKTTPGLAPGVPTFSRTHFLNAAGDVSNGTFTDLNSRYQHKVITDCADLRFVFANYGKHVGASGVGVVTAQTNPITVHAVLEVIGTGVAGARSASSVFFPIKQGGSANIVVPAEGFAVTDPLPVELAAGSIVYVATHVVVTSGQKFPLNGYNLDTTKFEGNEFATAGTDKTQLTTGYPATAVLTGYGPVAVYGTSRLAQKPVVGIFGDSRDAGTTTGITAPWALQALTAANIPAHQFALSGEVLSVFSNPAAPTRLIRMLRAGDLTHAVVGYPINDLAGGATLATIQGNMLKLWRSLALRGIKVYANTVLPYTSSTDSFATATNQTPQAAPETKRVPLNDWIRAGAPVDPATLAAVAVGTAGALVAGGVGHPLAGYIETADTVEVDANNTPTRNGGRWKAGATADGLHLKDDAGHALEAAALTAKLPAMGLA